MDDTINLSEHILYNGVPISEEDAILKIKEGALLSSFSADDEFPLRSVNKDGSPRLFTGVTPFMSFAAITYHEKGYEEISEDHWSRALAKYAVKRNYHALSFLPMQLRGCTAPVFNSRRQKLDRQELPTWIDILNEQDDDFLRAIVVACPQNLRYIHEDRRERIESTAKINHHMTAPKRKPLPTPIPEKKEKQVTILFRGRNGNLVTPEEYLARNTRDQDEATLDTLVKSNRLLPDNFLKTLLVPLRNAAFYKKHGDMQRAAEWRKKCLPFITKEKVLWISDLHAEAAIHTTAYLTEQGVDRLFRRFKDHPDLRKAYFLKLPEKFLKKEYLHDIYLSTEIFAHAPSLYKDSQEFYKYIQRHPRDILKLPAYQTEGLLLKDGVYLSNGALSKIEDPGLRHKAALALNLKEISDVPEA